MSDRLLEIRRTEDEVRKIYESPENKRRLRYWDNAELSTDYFHAIPKKVDSTPFIVECERPQYAKTLGFDFYDGAFVEIFTENKGIDRC